MAAIDFPSSPSVGQQFTAGNGATYEWTGVFWKVISSGPFLPLTGGVLSGPVTVNGAPGTNRAYRASTNGVLRWEWGAGPGAETGASAGSDFYLNAYSDSGVYNVTAMQFNRQTGAVSFGDATFYGAAQLNGTLRAAGNVTLNWGSGPATSFPLVVRAGTNKVLEVRPGVIDAAAVRLSAVNDLQNTLEPLELYGSSVTAPTPAAASSDVNVATTAFVKTAGATASNVRTTGVNSLFTAVNTFVNGPTTGSIGANGQTWLLIAPLYTNQSSGAFQYMEGQIWNGSAAVVSTIFTNDLGKNVCVTMTAIVTLTGATTFTVRAKNTGSASGELNADTSITAVRLA